MNQIRPAKSEDLPALAKLWFETWREAHMAHVPKDFTNLRTVESFHERLASFGDRLRMSGTTNTPMGFCVTNKDEIDQLFVSKSARGSGLAKDLLNDGELRLAKAGTREAFLYCIPENDKALRFYVKQGWRNEGPIVSKFTTSAGPFELKCDILRKTL